MLLIRGSIGPKVTELQEALNALGYDVVVDGTYGAATEETVTEFQAANNIAADGAYGPATHKKLQEALANAESGEENGATAAVTIPNVPLIRGSVGPKVTQLQEALNAAGYEVVVDGTYGAATEEAMMEFQAASNIAADGAYGPASFKKLLAALGGSGTWRGGVGQGRSVAEEYDEGDDEESDDEESDDEEGDDEEGDGEEEDES